MTPQELEDLTDEELDALRVQVLTEQERRRNATVIPAQIAQLEEQYNRGRGADWPELANAVSAFKSRNG